MTRVLYPFKRLDAHVRRPSDGSAWDVNLNTNYTLGTRFNIKVTANSTGINVNYNNGVKVYTFAGIRPTSTLYWYFKAGCYPHSNTAKGEAPNEYGEVLIYSLKTTHNGTVQ